MRLTVGSKGREDPTDDVWTVGLGASSRNPQMRLTVGSKVRIYEERTDEVYYGLERRTENINKKTNHQDPPKL